MYLNLASAQCQLGQFDAALRALSHVPADVSRADSFAVALLKAYIHLRNDNQAVRSFPDRSLVC
jgi:predicted negative regulator of RcsB-dependent stress response